MIRATYDALKARLETAPQLTGKIYASLRFNADAPVRTNYVILYPTGPDVLDDERNTSEQSAASDAMFMFDLRFIAVDSLGALTLLEAGTTVLSGHRLQITGRACTGIKVLSERVEHDAAENLFYVDAEASFRSSRA